MKMFLEKAQEINEKKLDVWVNSISKVVPSAPLSFKQQKGLISTVADGTVGALKFTRNLNNLIIEKTGREDLKVTDRLSIILELRRNSLGNLIKIEDVSVEIDGCVGRSIRDEPYKGTIITSDFIVEVDIPTLKQENEIISTVIQLLKKDGESDIGQNISNIYTYELVKYVKSIKFSEHELVFSELPIKDRLKIVENLPVTINKKIGDYIQKLKKREQEILTVSVKGEEKTFDIDVSFFDA